MMKKILFYYDFTKESIALSTAELIKAGHF